MIEKLNVKHTKVTPCGLIVALENLPNLNTLDHFNQYVVQALVQLHRRIVSKESNVTACLLTSLNCSDSDRRIPYVRGDFAAAASLCPTLTRVTLSCDNGLIITDQDRAALANMGKNLSHLVIDGPGFAFDGIVPILQNGSIEFLGLGRVSGVDVGLIAQLCPRLRSLKLFPHSFVMPSSLPANPLTRLEEMEVSGNVSADDLILLLSSPCLTRVLLSVGPNLSDRLLKRAFGIHGFRKLERLEFYNCSNLTKTAIDLFMTDKTRLKELRINDCPQLTKETATQWRALIKRNNWQLDIKNC